MKVLGYIKGTRKKKRKSRNVSNIINQQLSSVSPRFHNAFRGRRQHVEVVTPPSLFPKKSFLRTVYRIL